MCLIPSCLWSLRIFPSLPGSRLTIFYHDASSALLQLVNQWLNFTYSRSHAFRYERKNTNSGDKSRTHDFRTSSRYAGYLLEQRGDVESPEAVRDGNSRKIYRHRVNRLHTVRCRAFESRCRYTTMCVLHTTMSDLVVRSCTHCGYS